MILYYPKNFDENEWFIIVAVIINFLTFYLLPKRIPREITPLIVLLSISFPKILDHSMAVIPYDFYNITDTKNYEVFDLILYAVYPMFGYLFIYLYDMLKPAGIKFVLYLLSWSIFAVFFEYVLSILHVFTYTGWNIAFSLPVYLITLCLTFIFYSFTSNYLSKYKELPD